MSGLGLIGGQGGPTFGQIVFLFLGALSVDATIHAVFTTPFENWQYWWLKLLAAILAGTYLLSQNPRQ